MDTVVDEIQTAIEEPQPEPQSDTAPDDEAKLSQEISNLWSQHTQLSGTRRMTAKELRLLRAKLAQRLHAMKQLLCQVGRGGQWRGYLRAQHIPRTTADRLCERYAETLATAAENAPTGAINEPGEADVEKLAQSVWQRFRKTLATDEAVVQFIACIAEISGVGHEQRAEGLLICKPAPKAAEELPTTAPAIDPAPQPSEEIPAIAEEPRDKTAATPTEVGLAVAAAETSNGDVV